MADCSKFGKLHTPRTHEEARQVVCCVCSKKVVHSNKRSGVTKTVSDNVAGLVRQFVYNKYSVLNPLHPTALCGGCRLVLKAMEKVKSKLN